MIVLPEPPRLREPTVDVRISYLTGEQADAAAVGEPADELLAASLDFAAFVTELRGEQVRDGVPSTLLWYCAGEHYLGALLLRHALTDDLLRTGGHIRFHVVLPWRWQGHATRMLAEGLDECRRLGITRVLLTCGPADAAARQVVLKNGGLADGWEDGEERFWIATHRPVPRVL